MKCPRQGNYVRILEGKGKGAFYCHKVALA